MRTIQYPLAFLTTLLFTFTARSSVAFSINYPTNPDYSVDYTLGNYKGNVWLIPPTNLKLGGTNELLNLLNTFSRRNNRNWIFETGTDLEGSFDIKSYYACGPQTNCGKEIQLFPSKGGVGAFLDLEYHPAPGSDDPRPGIGGRNLQWIQRVKSNHSLKTGAKHNDIEDILDIRDRQTTPYYSGNAGNAVSDSYPYIPYRFFGDAPYRIDPLNNHTWNAELYLAEQITVPGSNIKTVRIYNGIKWGWRNLVKRRRVCPAKSSSGECTPPPPPPPPCNGGSGGGGCNLTNANATTKELPLFESDGLDAVKSSRDTLEETSLESDQSDFSNTEPSSSNSDNFNVFEDMFASSYSSDETDGFENEDVSFFDFNDTELEDSELAYLFDSDEYQSSESVPEPSSVFGLLALGVGGVFHSLKNRLGRKR